MAVQANIDTFRADNAALIQCPVFGATVEIRQCISLRDRMYKGEILETRKGCQACVAASKCPVAVMIGFIEEKNDHYFSAVPKLMRLGSDILKRIVPVVVPDHILKRYGDMSDSQRTAILATNGVAGSAHLKGAPIELEAKQASKFSRSKPPTPKSVEASTPIPVVQDAAALVNAMMEDK